MNYYQPSNLAALREIVGAQEGHCRFVAGCTDFLAQRNGRPWTKEALISLSEVGEMRRISAGAAGIFIGAACTHGQIAKDAMVRQHFPALAQACANVGSPQIRNRGTIGGSIANASPGGDIYPVLLLLGARAPRRRYLPGSAAAGRKGAYSRSSREREAATDPGCGFGKRKNGIEKQRGDMGV